MATQIFSRLEIARCDPSLLIGQGGYTLTTQADALSNSRKAMASLPKGVGIGYYEAIFWTDDQSGATASMSVGLATPNTALNTALGSEATSIAFCPFDGTLKSGGSTLQTNVNGACGERRVIQVYSSFSPSSCTIAIGVEGSFIFSQTISNGQIWVPAFTIAGGVAGNAHLYINTGLTGFLYPFNQVPA